MVNLGVARRPTMWGSSRLHIDVSLATPVGGLHWRRLAGLRIGEGRAGPPAGMTGAGPDAF